MKGAIHALAAGAISWAGYGVVPAAAEAEFYAGKSLHLIVASDAGGGFDTYSRALARTMVKHIPGQPTIVVQNMPGATGLTATNHLYNVAAKDGTVFGAVSNSNLLEPLYGNKNAKYDPLKFNWIGSMGKQRAICVTWHTSPIKSLGDATTRQVNVSATSATANNATLPRLLNQLIGTKFKVITGYSTSGVRLAMENGEVEGVCGLSYQTLIASTPHWFSERKLNVIGQLGVGPSDALPNVPNALDMVTEGPDKQALALMIMPQEMGRPHLAPPGVPAERVAVLRAAFDATMKDPVFLAEAEKLKLAIEPLGGRDMQTLLQQAYGVAPEVVARAVAFVGGGK